MESSGVEGVAILGSGSSSWASSPGLVVVHEPALPEVRARFLDNATEAGLWAGGLLCLTRAEWAIWSRTASSFDVEELLPLWGPPQISSAVEAPDHRRRARLRALTGLVLDSFHEGLAAGSDVEPLAAEARDRLEQEASPTAFPPLWLPGASPKQIHASVLGAFHATLGAEKVSDEGLPLDPAVMTSIRPARSAPLVRELLATLLTDLPEDFIGEETLALYLLPRAWGSRLSWNLVAVMADDAPLDRCAELRFALQQHTKMLPRRETEAVFGAGGGVSVLPLSSLSGVLRRRLFASPLRRLAVSVHRQLLLGSDVLSEALEGPEYVVEDLAFELAQIIEDMQGLWSRRSRACDVHELFYGRIPALLALLRGDETTFGLNEAQEALASSVDPAQAFAGRQGAKLSWCDPSTADLGRAREFLRDRGPMVLRLQEVAVESLLAFESEAAEPSG